MKKKCCVKNHILTQLIDRDCKRGRFSRDKLTLLIKFARRDKLSKLSNHSNFESCEEKYVKSSKCD